MLPVFLTGGAAHHPPAQDPIDAILAEMEPVLPDPSSHPPERSDHSDRLPASERNMLIFVASLLAAGTLAVIATMGLTTFGNHSTPTGTQSVTPSTTTAAPSTSPPGR